MTVRFYSSTATEKQLVGTITSGQTTCIVSDTVGLPTSFPYTLALSYETLTEELVQVSSAAGTTLTIVRAIDGTSAVGHAAGARVRHTSSARDFADSRNHENSDDGIHGLSIGEEIVGTDKVQTLTNKTLVNATGTLRNIDINNVPANVLSFTNNPAGVSTTPWIDMTNGSDKHLEITGNGNIRILNNVSLDGSTAGRRMAFLMSDGTTERFAIAAGGMATAFPRTGTADTNGGFKVIDPGDSTTRKMIQTRDSGDANDRFVVHAAGHVDITSTLASAVPLDVMGAAAQSASHLRVMTNTSTVLVQVDDGGQLEANRRAFIDNLVEPGEFVLQVRGAPAQTASLQSWQSSAGSTIARVRSDGSSNFTSRVDTSGIIATSAGWSLATDVAVEKAGMLTLNLAFTRTGADIVATSTGNIADTPVCTVNAAFRPDSAFGVDSLVTAGTTGVGTGSLRMVASSGDITLVTWSSNGSLLTGEILQMTFVYPLAFS